MSQEEIARKLPERTGKHFCVSCLAETPAAVYFANDYLCERCSSTEEQFPLASTPEAKRSTGA